MGFTRLDSADGPACGRCGCRDATIIQPAQPGRTWWPTGRARCRHCGTLFPFRAPEPDQTPQPIREPGPVSMPSIDSQQPGPFSTRIEVVQPTLSIPSNPAICPECGGKGLVRSTQGRTQYRQCKECGGRYKTQKFAS